MYVPQPGDVITVTTRHRDHYYKRTSDWRETTYENVRVKQPFSWMQAHEFCIPVPLEEQHSSIEQQEIHDRKYGSVVEFDQQTMRYKGGYKPGENGRVAGFDTRVISMKSVVAINGKPVEEFEESLEEVEIKASKGGSYKVIVENGIGKTCECKGFQFRGRCRHLQEAEESVK